MLIFHLPAHMIFRTRNRSTAKRCVFKIRIATHMCMHAGAVTRSSAYYGMGSGPILLSNLYCTGSEDTLLGCNRNMYGALSCTHRQDAGVVCEGK
jgi:hypothetical protein